MLLFICAHANNSQTRMAHFNFLTKIYLLFRQRSLYEGTVSPSSDFDIVNPAFFQGPDL